MEVEFAFLADAAESVNGKLYAMGGAFDTIWAVEAPVVAPRIAYVLMIAFSPGELERRHELTVNVVDADGKRVAHVTGMMDSGKRNPNVPAGRKQTVLSVLNFMNLKFDRFGDYQFDIMSGNFSLKSVGLRVAQHAKPSAA